MIRSIDLTAYEVADHTAGFILLFWVLLFFAALPAKIDCVTPDLMRVRNDLRKANSRTAGLLIRTTLGREIEPLHPTYRRLYTYL